MSRTFTLLTVAGIALVGGVVAYAAYFDYKRRNDVEFRKRLRKDKKRVDKTLAQSKDSGDSNAISAEELRVALETVRTEEIPKTVEAKEQYFMAQVSLGEQLALQGPTFFLPAALSFYRALRVYPSPVELIVIYQKTLPEPIFKIVMEMTNLDVSSVSSPTRPNNEEDDTSPTRGGPPSETSSQEWDKVTDAGAQTPAN